MDDFLFDPLAVRKYGNPKMPKAPTLESEVVFHPAPSGGSSGHQFQATDNEAREAINRLIAVNNQNAETLELLADIVSKQTDRIIALENFRRGAGLLFMVWFGTTLGTIAWRIFGG